MANNDKPLIVDGIKVNVTADDFDDIILLELIEEQKYPSMFVHLFGKEGYEEIKEKLRDKETGKVRSSRLMEWFQQVSEKVGAGN